MHPLVYAMDRKYFLATKKFKALRDKYMEKSDVCSITGCFNLNCGGFVQTNTQVPVGGAIDKVSVYDTNEQVVLRFSLIQVIISPLFFSLIF